MTRYSNNTENALVTFHTGRGGRFHNAGHVSFVDQDKTIDSYTDDLFSTYENYYAVYKQIGNRENLTKLLELAGETDAKGADEAYDKLKKYGLDLGELYYFHNDYNTGLLVDNDGTGTIDIDRDYNSTSVMLLKDCDEDSLRLIYESNAYVSSDVKEYCRVALGIEEEETEETAQVD